MPSDCAARLLRRGPVLLGCSHPVCSRREWSSVTRPGCLPLGARPVFSFCVSRLQPAERVTHRPLRALGKFARSSFNSTVQPRHGEAPAGGPKAFAHPPLGRIMVACFSQSSSNAFAARRESVSLHLMESRAACSLGIGPNVRSSWRFPEDGRVGKRHCYGDPERCNPAVGAVVGSEWPAFSTEAKARTTQMP